MFKRDSGLLCEILLDSSELSDASCHVRTVTFNTVFVVCIQKRFTSEKVLVFFM